jgi:hypothetical protein
LASRGRIFIFEAYVSRLVYRATIERRAERLRGERKPLEESPDTTGQGGG